MKSTCISEPVSRSAPPALPRVAVPGPVAEPGLPEAHAVADVVERLAGALPRDSRPATVSLLTLPAAALQALGEAMGEGEVSAVVADGASVWNIRETAFAGFWRVRREDGHGSLAEDFLEAGEVPGVLLGAARKIDGAHLDASLLPAGAANARPILADLRHHAAAPAVRPARVVNLSLLALGEADRAGLDSVLGQGPVVILSRSFGNCRIASTRIRGIWRVRYCNEMNVPVVDTIEAVEVPEAARAAARDIAVSRERLRALADWLRSASLPPPSSSALRRP